MPVVAKRIATLIKRIQAHGDILVYGLPGVEGDAAIAIRASLGAGFIDRSAIGFFEGAIDNASTGSAPKYQRAGPLQHLQALRVVDVAIVLHVVAETVDEEVRAGIDAPDDEFVP